MQDFNYPETDQFSLIMKATFYGITLVPKKYHLYTFSEINGVIKESQYSTKMNHILLIHFQEEILGYNSPMWIKKIATKLYN